MQCKRFLKAAFYRVAGCEYAEVWRVHSGPQVILLDFRVPPLACEQERIIGRLLAFRREHLPGRRIGIAVVHIGCVAYNQPYRAEPVMDIEIHLIWLVRLGTGVIGLLSKDLPAGSIDI